MFATITYWRAGLINVRLAVPMLVVAVALAPVGARVTPLVDQTLLLGLFVAFLVFAGSMMLFYRARTRPNALPPKVEMGVGVGVGGAAGFLGGLLGVGGGNFILPTLTWMGQPPKVAAGTTSLVSIRPSERQRYCDSAPPHRITCRSCERHYPQAEPE